LVVYTLNDSLGYQRVKFVLISNVDSFLDQGPEHLKFGDDKMAPDGTEHMLPAKECAASQVHIGRVLHSLGLILISYEY
jgi:hypothetical protein